MKRIYPIAVALFLLIYSTLFGQERISTEDYILRFRPVAIAKMKEYKIPASITLAQGILESGSGNSLLAKNANNHFGIKCHKEWTGKTYHMDDDEKNECFRKYAKAEQSYHDHSLFLTERTRYGFLFDYDIMDYKAWAKGLSKAGYATNPRYPELLISIIERYNLQQFDLEALKKKTKDKTPDTVQIGQEESHAYIEASPLDFRIVKKSKQGREVHINNGRKFIFAREGDEIFKLAAEFDIFSWQIVKYNEFKKKEKLHPNQIVYLEKKRRKSFEHETHYLREGESMHAVGQLYGIRLKRLYKLNGLAGGTILPVGSEILLK